MSAPSKKHIAKIVEEAEPGELTGSMPVWMFGLLGLLLYGSALYLDTHSGGFSRRVYEPFPSLEAVIAAQPGKKGNSEGKDVYKKYCALCHQENGEGNANNFVPPLAGSEWVTAPNPARMIRIVMNGLVGPIKVKGKDYGQGQMMPWKDVMTDDAQFAAVMTYMRGEWGNSAPEVTAEMVKQIRAEVNSRNDSWTSDELLKIPVE